MYFLPLLCLFFLLKKALGFSLKELAASVNDVWGWLTPLAEDRHYIILAIISASEWMIQVTQDDSATKLLMELLGKKHSLLTEELKSVGCTSPAGDGHLCH